jgi:Holliday junction resolvasome RuvABC endonuclease subunit
MSKYILAFDPSMAHCGWATLSIDSTNTIHLHQHGEWNLNTKRDIASANNVFSDCAAENFIGIAWESNPFGAAHGRTDKEGSMIRRGQSGAVGVLKGLAMAHGMKCLKPVNGMTAKKQYAGQGRATKEMMIARTEQRFNIIADEHECDAIGVGYTALQRWQLEQRMKDALKEAKKGRK